MKTGDERSEYRLGGILDDQKKAAVAILTRDQNEFDAANLHFLADMREQSASIGYGELGKNGTTGYPFSDTQQVRVHGDLVEHALSTHPPTQGSASVTYDLGGRFHVFTTTVGLMDDGLAATAITFRVVGDGNELWRSQPVAGPGKLQHCTVNIADMDRLELFVDCPGSHYGARCLVGPSGAMMSWLI